jgi:alpha/beta superfamily hydrolase
MPWRETAVDLARARAEIPVKAPSALGELFGVYTPPDPEAPAAGLCVVHLTRPRSHRNRNWVEAARLLAGRGFAAFRFDYHGTGDSGGTSSFLDPREPYHDDVTAVIRFVRERFGATRFVLTGSCFDARTALSAFRDEADAIAGLAFVAAPVMTLEHMRELHDAGKDWRHLLKALHNRDNWRALRDPERWRQMAQVVARVTRGAREPEPVAGPAVGPAEGPALDPGFLRDFDALVGSRARALFLYGEEDPEFRTFQPVLRDLWPALPPETRARFVVEVWPGEVHGGFLEMTRQRLILERVLDWVRGLHPDPSAHAAEIHRPAEGAWTSD